MEIQALPLKIKFASIQCNQHRESWRGDKPYIWNVFFKVGGESLVISDQFRLQGGGTYHFSKGSHQNLGTEAFSTGEVRSIPPEVGTWQTVLHPIRLPYFEANIPGVAGCLCILMEKGNLSAEGAEAGHQYLNECFQSAVDTSLSEFDPREIDVNNLINSIQGYFMQKLEVMAIDLKKGLTKAIVKQQSLVENLWTLVDKDTMLGYDVKIFTHHSFSEKQRVDFSSQFLVGKGGDWEVKGFVEVMEG